MERIRATYLFETALSPVKTAEIIAGEQSSGTFVPVPGESPELKARSAARVERLSPVDDVPGPALPGAAAGDGYYRRYELELSWPLANMGPSLPNLVATVAGNLFELSQVSGLKILDLDLPAAFAQAYPGPGFGVEGTRRLAGVFDAPLIGTIIKPSVGLSPEETASLVEELCRGGIDFIKDDELQADGPHCPFEARVRAVLRVLDAHEARTGRRVMYAANLTGEIDEMRSRHDLVAALGGTCVMLSLNSVGLAGVTALRRHAQLPIHAHRNGWGYLGRSPLNGWSYTAWQKLWRLAGVDHMHVNGLSNKFWEPDESVIASARACLTPMFPNKPCTVMPVFSSGQSAKQAPGTFEALGTTDLIFCAGGGIVAHPGGIASGVRALRQAWEAAIAGIALEKAAVEARELREALEMYGR
ncbi:MAG: ribulose-bisphosphate carboxylase large subunit family protein [Chloroflexota bacterium]|nr:ribulose-bisphosphate carboxylase large subunit family protein [Chloroflexota bacterium]